MTVLNVEFPSITENELLVRFTSGKLFTPNVDILLQLQYDQNLYDYYSQCDYVVCDSRVIRNLYFLLFGYKIPLIMGSTFFRNFYTFHRNNENLKIFLLGGIGETSQIAMNRINEKCERDIIVDAYSPPLNFEKNDVENQKIISKINASSANVLLLGLGTPKQELWILKNEKHLNNIKIYLPLGATIDFEAGTKPRAPALMQKLSLEWLFRLFVEPRRLFRRYLIEDPKFFILAFYQFIGRYKNPFDT